MYVKGGGMPNMGKTMGGWFLFNVVVAFFVAYLISRTVPFGAQYLQVFRVAGTVAFMAYATANVPGSVWWASPGE